MPLLDRARRQSALIQVNHWLRQDGPMQSADEYAPGVRRVLWITLALNIAVAAIKAAVGFATGSLAVLATRCTA